MHNEILFGDLKAVFINCSIKKDKTKSHTQKLMNRSIGIMKEQGVSVTSIYALDYDIAFGMIKDGKATGQKDDWPDIHKEIMSADILVIGTPIWLGVKSSVATLVIERMYAYSSETNKKDQYLYYGKTAGCVITGNEDGAKHCAMDILYAMSHIGFTIPPQADSAWLGGVGPGPSYGDSEYSGKKLDPPAGYDSEFTSKNTTYMAWNLMHAARMLKNQDGYPAVGNTSSGWKKVSNAAEQDPEQKI
jgi:multimeric flavodoxin WrbA